MAEVQPKRGDLLVIEGTESTFYINKKSETRIRYDVMEIVGLFRDGRIKTVRSLDFQTSEPLARVLACSTNNKTWVIPAQRIDKDAAVSAIQAHRWPGHEDSPMIRPFESIDEVRALLKPFVRTEPSPIGATQ